MFYEDISIQRTLHEVAGCAATDCIGTVVALIISPSIDAIVSHTAI
jgi:hypothetical protein